MIAAASVSAGSLGRGSSSEVLPAPRKPGSSAVTGGFGRQRARRSFHLRALFGRRGDDHRRGLGRRLLGFWLWGGRVLGGGGRRGRTILCGVLARLGLLLGRHGVARPCGGRPRARPSPLLLPLPRP